MLIMLASTSHPVWVRGLKLCTFLVKVLALASHPVWVRGLKQNQRCFYCGSVLSHPVWVRGLKHKQLSVRYGVGSRTPCGCVD